MNIVLSGPPFSGKTTIGKALAQMLGYSFLNTDTLLEQTFGMSCSEQYQVYGPEKFRMNERFVLEEIAKQQGTRKVVALGGGTLTFPDNAAIAKSIGTLVCLKCSFQELFSRLLKSGRIPAYLDENNIECSFKRVLKEREVHYNEYADFEIDISKMSPTDTARFILSELFTLKET